ncbi:hypothetical protein O3Q51_09770 [Cryomorphaceae bacterium 1068]|nr:hypothetical protein [Cryomorphaceae bacterium 1068]
MVLVCCAPYPEESFDWVGLLPALVTFLIGIGGYVLAYMQISKPLKAAKNERELRSVSKKLNEFYAPFYQLRKKSYALYVEFRKNCLKEDSEFTSTLKYLLEGKSFTGNTAVLLDEIIRIGEECESFIHRNAGLIDDESIRNDLLPRLTTHYRLLRLATEGKLSGDIDTIGKYTFPSKIDEHLENRIKELESDIARLSKG